MLYTTLENLKKHLQITGNAEDTTLTNLIETATELIDTDLGENLETTTKVRRIDGSGTIRLIMENRVNTVNYVREHRTQTPYVVDYIDGYIIYLTGEVNKGNKNIEISYVIGYDEVPKDFEKYFLQYCEELYQRDKITSDTQVVKTKKLGDLSVTYFTPSELIENGSQILASDDMQKIITKYKNFSIYSA